jgi:hypothetical protein
MTDQIDRTVPPIRRPPFSGVANQTLGGSQPDWEKMGAALPPGSARIVAIYDRGKADTVDATPAGAVRKSVAQVDGGGVKKLQAALAEAQAGMGG